MCVFVCVSERERLPLLESRKGGGRECFLLCCLGERQAWTSHGVDTPAGTHKDTQKHRATDGRGSTVKYPEDSEVEEGEARKGETCKTRGRVVG